MTTLETIELAAPSLDIPFGPLVSRNIRIGRRRTSVRLEPSIWVGLKQIGDQSNLTMNQIYTWIAYKKPREASMTAAIRVFALEFFRAAATPDGLNVASETLKTKIREMAKDKLKSSDIAVRALDQDFAGRISG